MRHEEFMRWRMLAEDEQQQRQAKYDARGIRFAYASAADSYDTKYQVGCVIMKDGVLLADGYNGAPSGFPNVTRDEGGCTLPTTLHAETNAIAKLAKTGRSCDGATIYTTLSPCWDCAKLIYQSGIVRIVFDVLYPDTNLELIKTLGIQIDAYRRH